MWSVVSSIDGRARFGAAAMPRAGVPNLLGHARGVSDLPVHFVEHAIPDWVTIFVRDKRSGALTLRDRCQCQLEQRILHHIELRGAAGFEPREIKYPTLKIFEAEPGSPDLASANYHEVMN
jgi:hypothetical protein